MSQISTVALSFRDDILVVEDGSGGVVLRGFQVELPFQKLSPGWRAVLPALSNGGMTDDQLGATVLAADGVSGLFQFQHVLGRLVSAGLISHTLRVDEQPFATLVPLSNRFELRRDTPAPDQPHLLSRFAYCHVEEGRMVLECPLGYAKILLHRPEAMRLIGALSRPTTAAELAGGSALGEGVVGTFVDFLRSAAALTTPTPEGLTVEDSSPTLAQWEFHDLLFHTRSRVGRHRNPYGGSYRWKERFPPLPPTKPEPPGEAVPLYHPDIEQLKQDDRPFTAVLEERASVRDYDDAPLTAEALGEFLYRCARVKGLYQAAAGEMSVSKRPYPAGGAIYELEIYAIVEQCAGLASGLYHYDPLEHQFHRVAEKNQLVETLLFLAWNTANRQSKPQVSLHITARFQRVQWKYQSMAYALVLKDVGVMLQTMYLVATAMGLAPCALGGGDSDLFAAAASLDYYAETTVGEFVLGSGKR